MKKTKIIALILCLLLTFSLCACNPDDGGDTPGGDTPGGNTGEENPPAATVDGKYILTLKTVEGADITDCYLYNVLELKDGAVKWYETDISGLSLKEGAYTLKDNSLTVTIGLREYVFDYDKTAATLAFSGKISRKQVVMNYAADKQYVIPSTRGEVSFTERLFGESLDENFYNYCPSVITEGSDTMHVWYCANAKSGNVTDYVAYRKGTLSGDGKWSFTEKQLVLEPTAGTWDSRHTCDPSVVKGNYSYKGEQYNYLMAYLGCKTSDNTRNEVGIALAVSPEGPWIKPAELNPIANFYANENEYNAASWGYGQPSLINVDKNGTVILFYSKGIPQGTYTYAEMWDLSDVDNARKIREGMVSNVGVTNAGGQTDVINNADFAYDPVTNRLYCVKEDFGYPTGGGVNWIAGSNTVMYMELSADEEYPCKTLFDSPSARWTVFDKINEARTGFARNHNCGIVTDVYGWVANPSQLPVVYTMSRLVTDFPNWSGGGQWPALHTYRLHGTIIEL